MFSCCDILYFFVMIKSLKKEILRLFFIQSNFSSILILFLFFIFSEGGGDILSSFDLF